MALVKCRECGKEVSSSAKSCPHCGIAKPAPLEPMDMTISKPMKAFLKFLLYCFVCIFVISAVIHSLPKDTQYIGPILLMLLIWGGIIFWAWKKWRAWQAIKDQLPEESPISPKALKETALGGIVVIGIFFVASLVFSPNEKKQETVRNISAEMKANEDIDNSCFIAGKSLATVTIANISQLASADLMPSQVMDEGCSKKADTAQDKQRCINNCKLGFRSVAREALK